MNKKNANAVRIHMALAAVQMAGVVWLACAAANPPPTTTVSLEPPCAAPTAMLEKEP